MLVAREIISEHGIIIAKLVKWLQVFWYLSFGDEDRFILERLESLPTGQSYRLSH